MFLLLIVKIFLFISSVTSAKIDGTYSPNHRLIGGKEAKIDDYPFFVSVEFMGAASCVGSIISDRWVLSAAHCYNLPSATVKSLKIRAGTNVRQRGGTIHQVDIIIRHENHSINTRGIPLHDIAVYRVVEPFVFNNTHQPVPLFNASEAVPPNVKASVISWNDNFVANPALKFINIPILPKVTCNEAYSWLNGLPDDQICAGFYEEGGVDFCRGDYGAPLVINGRQAGIASWNNGCAEPGSPGVHTNVAYYRDWIKQKTQV